MPKPESQAVRAVKLRHGAASGGGDPDLATLAPEVAFTVPEVARNPKFRTTR